MIPDPPTIPPSQRQAEADNPSTPAVRKFSTSQLVDAVVLIVMIICVTVLAFAGHIPATLLGVVYAGSLGWVGAKVTGSG